MMILSDEQMSIVSGPGIKEWVDVQLPTGNQEIPDWCKGANIDWGNGHAGAPTVTLKVHGKVGDWENKRFRNEGKGAYIARHPDGRLCVHYHSGSVSKIKLKDQRNWKYDPENPSKPTEIEVMATTQQDGYAGGHYWLTMEDGSDLVLRGPWHGGAPDGYVEVHICDVTSEYFNAKWGNRHFQPWYRRGSQYGLYISEELFIRIISKFAPHARLMRVQHTYGERLEPYREEWSSPKIEIYELERHRAIRKEGAGPFWRVYHDRTYCYCGSFSAPKYGYRDEVHSGDRHTQEEVDRAEALRARRGF